VTELHVREGDGDAGRSGYWTVTGPQDEREVYAAIELSRITDKHDVERTAYAWYLFRRTVPDYNSIDTYMREVARGDAPTFDASLDELRDAWWVHTIELP